MLGRAHPLQRKTPLRARNPERRARRDAKYNAYLDSAVWAALRAERLRISGGICECGCGRRINDGTPESAYQCHHIRYTFRGLGNEDLNDLRAYRAGCHAALHRGQRWYKGRRTW